MSFESFQMELTRLNNTPLLTWPSPSQTEQTESSELPNEVLANIFSLLCTKSYCPELRGNHIPLVSRQWKLVCDQYFGLHLFNRALELMTGAPFSLFDDGIVGELSDGKINISLILKDVFEKFLAPKYVMSFFSSQTDPQPSVAPIITRAAPPILPKQPIKIFTITRAPFKSSTSHVTILSASIYKLNPEPVEPGLISQIEEREAKIAITAVKEAVEFRNNKTNKMFESYGRAFQRRPIIGT